MRFRRFVLWSRKGRVKRPNIETLLQKVCIVNNQIKGKPHIAGGVFISKDGVIATCHHILGKSNNDRLSIELNGNTSRRFGAEILGSYPQLDLAILRVLDCPQKTFKCVKLPRTISLDWGDRVFAFSQSGDPFSATFGRVAYPHPKRTKLAEVGDAVGTGWVTDVNRPLPWLEVQHYLIENKKPGSSLLPNLPIIKVHDVCPEIGTSGCPLFMEKSLQFVGIALHSRGGRGYFLPSTVIRKAYPHLN